MTKAATIWKPLDGRGDPAPDNEGDFLLQQNDDNLLQQNGDDLLLNDTVVTPKPATAWDNE